MHLVGSFSDIIVQKKSSRILATKIAPAVVVAFVSAAAALINRLIVGLIKGKQ